MVHSASACTPLQAAAGYPFAFPGVDECGLWAPNYTRVHTKILRRKQAQKFITLLPSGRDGDIGSSLMGVVSVFLAALLTNRAIVITDPNVLNAFDPAGVDWRAGPDVPMTATAGERGEAPRRPGVECDPKYLPPQQSAKGGPCSSALARGCGAHCQVLWFLGGLDCTV